MHRLKTRTESDLAQPTLDNLEPVRIGGKISDVYLQFANSEGALRTYLQMEATLREGSLSDVELESIKLLVSEKNRCDLQMNWSSGGVQPGLEIGSSSISVWRLRRFFLPTS